MKASHVLIHGELLIVGRGGRAQRLSDYQLIWRAISVPHEEVVEFVRERKLHGRGLGWIDAHFTCVSTCRLFAIWTAEGGSVAAASDLGIAYSAPIRLVWT